MALDVAYVAGLIDGEGCVSIAKSGLHFAPRVDVGMTKVALPLLRRLHEEWGGTLDMNRAATERWAEAWRWILHGPACRPFLEAVQPHVRLKREQCSLALALCDLRDSLVPVGGQKARWTKEAADQAEFMKDRMRELNAKGPQEDAAHGWIARLVGDRWMSPQTSLLTFGHLELFSGTLPASGSMSSGRVYERARWVPRIGGSGGSLLPTPRANKWGPPDSHGHVPEQLLPTPAVNDMGDRPWAQHPGAWEAWLDEQRRRHGNGNGHGRSLAIEAQRLLPTPTARDWKDGDVRDSDVPTNALLGRAASRLLPTPRSTSRGASTETARLIGETTDPPSTDGPPSSDDQHPTLWTTVDGSPPDSPNG